MSHPINSSPVFASTDPSQRGRDRREETYFAPGRQGLFTSPVVYSMARETPVLIISGPVRDATVPAHDRLALLREDTVRILEAICMTWDEFHGDSLVSS